MFLNLVLFVKKINLTIIYLLSYNLLQLKSRLLKNSSLAIIKLSLKRDTTVVDLIAIGRKSNIFIFLTLATLNVSKVEKTVLFAISACYK